MRYFCVQDCFTNNQYFYGGRFYEDYDIQRGVEEGGKAGDGKWFVQVSPSLGEPKEPRELKEGQSPTGMQREERARWEKDHARWVETRGFLESAIADAEHPKPLPIVRIDEPTLHMTFRTNTSPFVAIARHAKEAASIRSLITQ